MRESEISISIKDLKNVPKLFTILFCTVFAKHFYQDLMVCHALVGYHSFSLNLHTMLMWKVPYKCQKVSIIFKMKRKVSSAVFFWNDLGYLFTCTIIYIESVRLCWVIIIDWIEEIDSSCSSEYPKHCSFFVFDELTCLTFTLSVDFYSIVCRRNALQCKTIFLAQY